MQEVVGVALVREGRVLAARRSSPPALAGLWEFPGGKVEPGEEPGATAVREITEELRCTIEVTGWLSAEVDVTADASSEAAPEFVLSVATARLVDGDPVPTEHDAVRWLRADQLDEVRWAAADLPFLDPVRQLLDEGGPEQSPASNRIRT
jgi:8-oxo-dGTP diphosphatase